ncbi:HD domain-containing protein [Mycobacterium sp. JS623]|uniref:HD domain-containing protein n=1 Tax=Mycobacterium sp. JS623 TaxID=212767 RepID=UPI0002A5AE7C|nr:HD domain-containing protein [Mycobacterium sp. JS623]AGB23921.1 HD domain-containing protein [Mycobacterium sp. JS623]
MSSLTGRIDLPDSEIACAAKQFVYDVSPAFVAQHSLHSYLYDRELAAAKGLQPDVGYDDELVFLSCMLHDLGVGSRARGQQRFEVEGADLAAELLIAHGVSTSDVDRVWEAIEAIHAHYPRLAMVRCRVDAIVEHAGRSNAAAPRTPSQGELPHERRQHGVTRMEQSAAQSPWGD